MSLQRSYLCRVCRVYTCLGSLVHRPQMRGPSRTISSLTISSFIPTFFLFAFSSKSLLYFPLEKGSISLKWMEGKLFLRVAFDRLRVRELLSTVSFSLFKGGGRLSTTMGLTFNSRQYFCKCIATCIVESDYRWITFNFREWARYFRGVDNTASVIIFTLAENKFRGPKLCKVLSTQDRGAMRVFR